MNNDVDLLELLKAEGYPTGRMGYGYSMTRLTAWCGSRLSAALTTFWMYWQNTSRTPQTDSKSSSRQDPFQATPRDSFGLEPNTKAIGIGGRSGKWKDGCVQPSSSISKALPKRFSCGRPPKAHETVAGGGLWVSRNRRSSLTSAFLRWGLDLMRVGRVHLVSEFLFYMILVA